MADGFTYPDGHIEITLTGQESSAESVVLVLHELAHSRTGRGHSAEWWGVASDLYTRYGVFDQAIIRERSYYDLWGKAAKPTV